MVRKTEDAKARASARCAAHARLAKLHRAEYNALYQEELARRGITGEIYLRLASGEEGVDE